MGTEVVTPESRQPFEGLHPKRGERKGVAAGEGRGPKRFF